MIGKIAFTGSGGGVGQSIIKSLYNTPYDVLALDSEIYGAELPTNAKSHIITYAKNPNY